MTVQALREILEKFPGDSQVYLIQEKCVVVDGVKAGKIDFDILEVSVVCDIVHANHGGVLLDSRRLEVVSQRAQARQRVPFTFQRRLERSEKALLPVLEPLQDLI